MSLVHITKENFQEVVMEAENKVLLDFWATWCGPCQMIAPVLEEVAQENEHIVVGKIDVDEQRELAVEFGITSIPTLMVVEKGQVTAKALGFRQKADVLKLLGE